MLTGRGPRAVAVVVLAAGAVTAFTLGRLNDQPSTAAAPPPDAVSSPVPAPAPSAARQSSSAARGPELGSHERSDPETAAANAIAAWQQQNIDTRIAGLSTTATPGYQAAATDIEPSRVPTSPLASTSLRVEADGQALVDARLEDGTALAVLVVQVDDTWLVDDLRPADDLDAAGAP